MFLIATWPWHSFLPIPQLLAGNKMFLTEHLTVAYICNSLFTPLSSVQNSKLSEGKNQGYLCLSPTPSLWHTQVDSTNTPQKLQVCGGLGTLSSCLMSVSPLFLVSHGVNKTVPTATVGAMPPPPW